MGDKITLDGWIKILTLVGALCSFLWGVYQWRERAREDLRARQAEAAAHMETRRIEATKPFLDRQLALYAEATKVAAKVATQGLTDEGKRARARFWELYWGELATVENRQVEAAMVGMGNALNSPSATAGELQLASLAIARACRESLDRSWGIHAWSSPDDANPGVASEPAQNASR